MRSDEKIHQRFIRLRTALFGPRGQRKMAGFLGISPQRYNTYETGTAVPHDVLAAAAKSKKIDISWLLTGDGEMFHKEEATAAPPNVAEAVRPYATVASSGDEALGAGLAESLREAVHLAAQGKVSVTISIQPVRVNET